MDYDVRLVEFPGVRHLAVVRLRAALRELPRVVPAACGKVWNAIKARQVTGAGRHVALYLDDQINLEVGVELDAPFAGDGGGDVVPSSLPQGTAATAVHFGPYDRLHGAHQAIRDWCAAHDHALAGPNWEIYGHWVDEWNRDPSKIRTDVFYLLNGGADSSRGR